MGDTKRNGTTNSNAFLAELLKELQYCTGDATSFDSVLKQCAHYFDLTAIRLIGATDTGVLHEWAIKAEDYGNMQLKGFDAPFLALLEDCGVLFVGPQQSKVASEQLQNYQTQAACAVFMPIYQNGTVYGSVVFEDNKHARIIEQEELELMKSISALLSFMVAQEIAVRKNQYAKELVNVLSKLGVELNEAVLENAVKALDAIDIEIDKLQPDIDQLTGACNRMSGFRKLSRLLLDRKGRQSVFSVLFVDIDEFRTLNDQYGQAEGDEMIQMVANVLSETKRGMDILCRMGSDEFLLILPSCSEENAQRVVGMVHQKLERLNAIKNKGYKVAVSIGLLEVTEDVKMNADEIIKFLYGAMVQEKMRKK